MLEIRNGMLLVSLLAVGTLLLIVGFGGGSAAEEARLREMAAAETVQGLVLAGIVSDQTGEPVAGGTVELVRVLRRGDREDRKFFADLRTDDRGAFRFVGLPAGEYWLHGEAPGHLANGSGVRVGGGGRVTFQRLELARGGVIRGRVVDARGDAVAGAEVVARQAGAGWHEVLAYSDGSGAFEVGPLVLDAVATLSARHAGFRRVVREAVAPGTTGLVLQLRSAGAIEGRLLDADGKPLAGSLVAALPPRISEATGIVRGRTAADGSFRLDGVASGPARLVALGAGHLPCLGPRVLVQTGRTCGDVLLRAELGRKVVVRVGRTGGAPVAGAEVVLEPRGARTADWGGAVAAALGIEDPDRARRLQTDTGGRAVFEAVPSGPMAVSATSHSAKAGELRSRVQEIDGAAPEIEVRLVVEAPGTLRYAIGELAGSGDTVDLVLRGPLEEGPWCPVGLHPAVTSAGVLDDLLPGTYELALVGTGGVLRSTEQGWRVCGAVATRVVVEAGTVVESALSARELVALEGMVQRGGATVDGADVRLRALAPHTAPPAHGIRDVGWPAETHSNGRGWFGFSRVVPGRYLLVLQVPDVPLPAVVETEVAGSPAPARLAVDVRTQAVRFEVRDGAGGAPVAGASVALRPAPAGVEGISGADFGYLERSTGQDGVLLLPAVACGRYAVSVEHSGYLPAAAMAVDVEPGSDARRVVVLQPAGRLLVEVEDRRGRPVADARVVVFAEGEARWSPAPDRSGGFLFDGVRPGAVRVEARASAGVAPDVDAVVETTVAAGELRRVRLVLPIE